MDEKYMQMAIDLAAEAATHDEVPVGAVVVMGDKVIAAAANRKERDNCACHHAEMLALIEASRAVGNWYLDECEMYVTLEPCAMCAGAIVNCRLRAVYFGAYDTKSGCLGSVYDLVGDKRLNHRMQVQGGILSERCGKMLSDFFAGKRKK